MRRALPAVLAALALSAAPGLARADDEPVGTTTGGGYVTIDRVDLPDKATISEGQRRSGTALLSCHFDECSYWLGPREGTAKAGLGDFNPFRVVQVDLVRGQTVRQPYTFEALKDNVAEITESFSFVVRTDVRDAGGPWYERENQTTVKILDVRPPRANPTTTTASRPARCYSC